MLKPPSSLPGVDELETKILNVDESALIARLRGLGAVELGSVTITEQRYHPTAAMAKDATSLRLRKLVGGGSEHVELVLKQKLAAIPVPGRDILGPRLKRRKEFEVELENTKGNGSRFEAMRLMLRYGFRERDQFVTNRLSYMLTGIRCELDRVVEYDGSADDLPPAFLEIEGTSAEGIVATAAALGYGVEVFSPFTKREVLEKFRKKKRKSS